MRWTCSAFVDEIRCCRGTRVRLQCLGGCDPRQISVVVVLEVRLASVDDCEINPYLIAGVTLRLFAGRQRLSAHLFRQAMSFCCGNRLAAG